MTKAPRLEASLFFYLAVALMALAPGLFSNRAYFEGDLIAQNIPYWDFFKSCLSQGHWPLWCPYLFAGQPFAADSNCMVFYPPAYLYLLPSRALGTNLFYVFHLALALGGAHLWLRSAGFSQAACRIGAVLYGLSGFFWWEIIHPQVLAGYAWLPWWGLALERLSQTGARRWAFAAGLCFALLFLSGHFQIPLGAAYGGAVYFLFRALTSPKVRLQKKVSWKMMGALAGAGVWGLLPLLALAIPFFEFSGYSSRVHEAFDYMSFNAPLSDSWSGFSKFLFPARAWNTGQYSMAYQDILENSGFLGIWWPFLFWLAFKNVKGRRWFWFWSGFGVFGILLCLGEHSPLHPWFCRYVLGFAFVRAPYRFVYLYCLAGAFLAALGWSYWGEQNQKARRRLFPWILGYVFLIAGLSVFYFHPFGPAILGLGLGVLGLGWRARGQIGEWVFAGALALSMTWSGWQTCPSRLGPDSNFDFLKNRPELAELKQKTGLGRAFIDGNILYPLTVGDEKLTGVLPPDAAYSLGLRDVQGYNPLSLWKTSQLFSLSFETAARLLAVNAIAKNPSKPFILSGFIEQKAGDFDISYAPKPFPFVYAPKRFEVVESEGLRLHLMGQEDFNPYELSYFSQPPPQSAPSAPGGLSAPGFLNYQLTRDDPDDQIFEVGRQNPGWTVFSEVVYPGWKVWVDGVSTPLLTANHVFRAVFVPAGNHEVRFRYEPAWWTPIRLGILLWFFSVLGLFWKPWREWALGVKKD
jgi:hypothetical protein